MAGPLSPTNNQPLLPSLSGSTSNPEVADYMNQYNKILSTPLTGNPAAALGLGGGSSPGSALLDFMNKMDTDRASAETAYSQAHAKQLNDDLQGTMAHDLVWALANHGSSNPLIDKHASAMLQDINTAVQRGSVLTPKGEIAIDGHFNLLAQKALSDAGLVNQNGVYAKPPGVQEAIAGQVGANKVAELPSDVALAQVRAEAEGRQARLTSPVNAQNQLAADQRRPHELGPGSQMTQPPPVSFTSGEGGAGIAPTAAPTTAVSSSQLPPSQGGSQGQPAQVQPAQTQGVAHTGDNAYANVYGTTTRNSADTADLEKQFAEYQPMMLQNQQAIYNLSDAMKAFANMRPGVALPLTSELKRYLVTAGGADANKLSDQASQYQEAQKALAQAQGKAAHLISSRGTNLDLSQAGKMLPNPDQEPNALVHNTNSTIGQMMYQNDVIRDMENYRQAHNGSLAGYSMTNFASKHNVDEYAGYGGEMYPFIAGEKVGNRGEPVPDISKIPMSHINALRANPGLLEDFQKTYGVNTGRRALYGPE